jgi:hypothetical protein
MQILEKILNVSAFSIEPKQRGDSKISADFLVFLKLWRTAQCENSTVTPKRNEHEVTQKPIENSEIFRANSEKSKCLLRTLLQLFHSYSFDGIVMKASKVRLI